MYIGRWNVLEYKRPSNLISLSFSQENTWQTVLSVHNTNARKDELDPIYSLKEGWTLVNISSTPDRYSPTEPRPGKQTHIGAIWVFRENFYTFCQNISTPLWSSPTVWVPRPQTMWDCYFCSWDDDPYLSFPGWLLCSAVVVEKRYDQQNRLQSQRQSQSNCTKKWQKVGWAHPMGGCSCFCTINQTANSSLSAFKNALYVAS